mgnify:CR=1 FL=1
MDDKVLIEKLSDLEHRQWVEWSYSVAEFLQNEINKCKDLTDYVDCYKLIMKKIKYWKTLWVPYSELNKINKDKNREWADKVLEIIRNEIHDKN